MRKLTQALFAFLLLSAGAKAQTGCSDLNGYVGSKNTGGTGYYTLQSGFEEKAAQTYHYSGPGKLTSLRVYGNYPGMSGGVPLRVGVYNVDANGRPTTQLASVNDTWWWFDNMSGYITVYFPYGGVNVSNNFAATVELRNASPWGSTFQLKYTGDGEGLGQDLPSLAGTSTGSNWTSAMTNFNKDGDFYLVPRMTNFINPDFVMNTSCIAAGGTVSFTNQSDMTTDSMFNTIGLAAYSGSTEFYSWNFGDGSPVSHVANPTHTYATAGAYTVTLTCAIDGWNNDCSASTSMVVSVGLQASATATNASCYASSNGTLNITAAGGASPYTYSIDGESYQSGNTFNNLGAGNYTVYIIDDNGCTASSNVTVTQPNAIVISSIFTTNASCSNADGGMTVSASGGTGSLQYQLNSSAFQSSNVFNNLASGTYTVTVKDANSCSTSNYVSVNNQGAPVMTIVSVTHVSCNNGNNGSIVLSATGGSGTLMYSINGGQTWQTSGSFTNVSAGVHPVMVKDANGCSVGTNITIQQPPAIAFTTSTIAATCSGAADGSISVTSHTGGTGTLVYSLNNINFQSSSNFNNLMAGSYTIYVKDIAGCTASASVLVDGPTTMTVSTATTNVDCHNGYTGTITVTVTGGNPGYVYSIDGEYFQSSNVFNELPAGTYTITVADNGGESECYASTIATITESTPITASITTGASSCGNANGTLLAIGGGGSGSGYQYSINGTNFNSNGSFSGLVSGNYDVIITDSYGCENVFQASINDANGPSITSTSHTNVACNDGNDGTITINSVTGGTGTLQYSVNGSNWQTSNAFSGLDAGTYTVLVKDANGCVGQSSVTLTEPNPIVVTAVTNNVTCYGSNSGSATVNAAGGAGTLAYDLNNAGFQSSNLFNGLGAGAYTVTVRDAAGCFGSEEFTITQPTEITMSIGVLNVMCNGDVNGAINVSAAGGTGTLTYSLDGVNYQSGSYFSGLAAGTYTVFVKDANGCTVMAFRTISQPSLLVVTSNVLDVSCAGGNNGVIDLTATGGTAPYSFSWSDETSNEDLFNLPAGSYSVTVTDDHGCTNVQNFTITQPASPIVVNGVISDATSQTSADGNIDITTTGGTGPYSFQWSNGATTEDVSGLLPGTYSVSITDMNGCVTSGTFTVAYTIGITEHSNNAAGVTLYPNPAHESFTIDAGGASIDKLEVMNMLGEIILTMEPRAAKAQVLTDGLSHGVYFVRIYTHGAIVTKRVDVAK